MCLTSSLCQSKVRYRDIHTESRKNITIAVEHIPCIIVQVKKGMSHAAGQGNNACILTVYFSQLDLL